MAKIRLTWQDKLLLEDGVRIYRSTSPINPASLPAPLASVPVGRGVYEDKTVTAGQQYHYYVAPFSDSTVGSGLAVSVTATEEVPRFLYATQQVGLDASAGQTLTFPLPDCKAGDLLVIFGLRRSAFTSVPAGWTQGPTPANAGNSSAQWTFAMWKIATGTEGGTNVTLTQTNVTRLSVSVAVIRHDSKPLNVTALGTARFDGESDAQPYSFTNTNKPALVMSILSWFFQAPSGTTEVVWSNARMIPMMYPAKTPITEPNTKQIRFFAWFVEAAASEAFNSGTLDITGDATTDSRSDIHLAIWV